jgi:hypothetical protein
MLRQHKTTFTKLPLRREELTRLAQRSSEEGVLRAGGPGRIFLPLQNVTDSMVPLKKSRVITAVSHAFGL